MLATVEGVFRNGRIELVELPKDLSENTPVIVTFLSKHFIDLQTRKINEKQAAELRASLTTFAEDWESPEMEVYDDYDKFKAIL